jgi:hypothetical protein
MVSRVQHQTASVLKAAKSSNLGRATWKPRKVMPPNKGIGQIKTNPHCHCGAGMAGHCTSRHCGSKMGAIIQEKRRDIATDTIVYEPVVGRKYGEDPAYDLLNIGALGLGAYILSTFAFGKYRDEKMTAREAKAIQYMMIIGGTGAFLTGAFHITPGTLKLL